MKVVIVANGDSGRLSGILDDKLLFPVRGVPLIRRTVLQVRDLGARSISVVTSRLGVIDVLPDVTEVVPGAHPKSFMRDYRIALQLMPETGITYVLLGDTVWTDEALIKLFSYKHYVLVGHTSQGEGFGRAYYGPHKGVYLNHMDRVEQAISERFARADGVSEPKGGGGWQLYYSLSGLPLWKHSLEPSTFCDLGEHDPTRDLDREKDVNIVKEAFE